MSSLPETDVRIMIELGLDELEMALRFQVSRELVQLRLSELGLRALDLVRS